MVSYSKPQKMQMPDWKGDKSVVASIAILVSSIFLSLYQVPILLEKKMSKECYVFISLLFVAALVNIALAMGIHLPNPMDYLVILLKPISDRIELLLT